MGSSRKSRLDAWQDGASPISSRESSLEVFMKSMRDQVRAQVREQVQDQVWNQTDILVQSQAWDQVYNRVVVWVLYMVKFHVYHMHSGCYSHESDIRRY